MDKLQKEVHIAELSNLLKVYIKAEKILPGDMAEIYEELKQMSLREKILDKFKRDTNAK